MKSPIFVEGKWVLNATFMTLGSKCECPGCTHVGGIKQAANVAGNFEGLSLLSLCIVWVGI